ncbi:MAG TPA: hypothetical protein VEO93_04090 [Gemmatimonadales bacterium]|nr:hypothetical protein [Gemmatimonadales bacterium]
MIRPTLVPALLVLAACMPPRRRAYVEPCSATIDPIRNQAMLATISVSYTYRPEDEAGARTDHRGEVLNELNTLGSPDGNSFAEPNGQQTNFIFNFSISNDGQDHFTGGLELRGWGQGLIHNFGRYQYSYASTEKLVRDLTDEAYGFIHGGWHDSRPSCTGR